MVEDPYAKSRIRRFSSELEFKIFKEQAAKEYSILLKDVPYFEIWSRYQTLNLIRTESSTLQFSFSPRPMGRVDHDGKWANESGLSLVYSIGPTGAVDIQLYPLKSTLAQVHETMIHLDLNYFTAYELMQRLKSDLSDLITYGYVTSLDADTTWLQEARIWFLRVIKAKQIEGKFEKAPFKAALFGGLATFGSLVFRGFLASFFKPIVLIIVILLSGYLGWDILKSLIAIMSGTSH